MTSDEIRRGIVPQQHQPAPPPVKQSSWPVEFAKNIGVGLAALAAYDFFIGTNRRRERENLHRD